MERVLITGGAGFIGSHLADELLRAGYRVRILDNLHPQVHGPSRTRPAYLAPDVEMHRADVRDPSALSLALKNVDAVVHLAARVGVGQSMYRIADYADVNVGGTAALLEQLLTSRVERLVIASSMSAYGEGLYLDSRGEPREAERDPRQARRGQWDIAGPDGAILTPVPTPESKRPSLASHYALTKFAQERMCLIHGQAHGFPVTALRFFNTYGTRQALSNPYTGALAIFASRLLNGRAPLIYEDGLQRRDFVHVSDVAHACRLALERAEAAGRTLNVGSGQGVTIRAVAERVTQVLDAAIPPRITGEYRAGDIRHCFASIAEAQRLLGFTPGVTLDEGLKAMADWLAHQTARDHVEAAHQELVTRRLAQ